jgi:hypothetical protein
MKQLIFGLLLIPIFFLASCKEQEKPKQKQCNYVMLDWPEAIAQCITPEEERGLRDRTKTWLEVWDRMKRDCPNIEQHDNGAALVALTIYPDAITVSGKEDLMNKLKARTQQDSCCIKKLVIRGHGCDGLLTMGSGRQIRVCKYVNGDTAEIVNNRDDWKRDLADLKGLFCDSAELHLEGCEVGHGDIGLFKMQEIAREFGVTVLAPTTKMSAGRRAELLGADSVRRVSPSAQITPPPAGAREKSNKLHKEEKMKNSTGKAAKPFKKKVAAMGFYPVKFEDIPDVTTQPQLPITDVEWISAFTAQVDGSNSYDANLELYTVDATILLKYEDGSYQFAYTVYGHSMFGITVEGLGDMQFSLSENGTKMVLEGINRTAK